MTTILIAGYRSHELGIFHDKDKRITRIKQAIRRQLIRFLDDGAEWFVFMGNLGFDYWVLEELLLLREEGYQCSLGVMFCFADHGHRWSEANQIKLHRFNGLDFVKSCFDSYHHSGQLKAYYDFLVANTQAAFLFYDDDYQTRLSMLRDCMRSKQDYSITQLTFEDLNYLD